MTKELSKLENALHRASIWIAATIIFGLLAASYLWAGSIMIAEFQKAYSQTLSVGEMIPAFNITPVKGVNVNGMTLE